MGDHDEVERMSGNDGLSLSRRALLRLGLLTVASTAPGLTAGAPGASAQTAGPGASLIGKLEGAVVVTDSDRVPEELQGSAGARRTGQGGQAAARPGAHRPGPAGRQALARNREVRGHLAPRLHRPLRHLQRAPRRPERQAPLLGLHRDQDRAQHRPGLGGQSGRQDHHPPAAPRDAVERRDSLHRRRLRLLVPGHVPEHRS